MKNALLTSLAACFLLASCADEPLNEPTELQDIDEKFSVDSRWTEAVGDGDDGKFNSLVPAVWENKVVTADVAGLVTAFDRASGDILWEADLETPLSGGVTANAGVVAVGSKDAEVFVLDVNDGKQLWKAEVSSEVLAKPAIEDGKLVVRTGDGRIFAFDINSGKQEWFYDRVIPNLTLRGTSAPLATGGIALTGFANGKLAAFNLQTGDLLWEQRISAPRGSSEISRIVDVDATPVVYGSTLYAAGYNGFAIALDLTNGRYLWRNEASVTKDLLVDATRVYMVTTDGKVAALDRFTGDPIWQAEDLMYRSLTGAADNGGNIIVGDFEGYLHWLDKETGTIVAREHLDDNGVSHTPIVTNNEIIASSRYGYMYVFDNPQAESATAETFE
ncbi:MAG: outer membrane protein assembly factor BamB [Kangiellaceae bacterium]|nr:outer membrane protein assembly factor BamB [Kangiellaceae bacterium]